MKNIILIHGVGGPEKESYFKYIKNECEKLGLNVFIPKMPGYKDDGTYEKWREIFDRDYKNIINETTLMFGQSLGTQFAVKYLAEKNKEIKAYISCAGMRRIDKLRNTPENDLMAKKTANITATFFISPSEYAKFKNLKFPKFSIYSNDDKFFEQSNLEHILQT